MTQPFAPSAFRLADILQDAASRAVAVDPRDTNSPRGNLALLGDMNYRRQADGRFEAQPQVDALGLSEARASDAYLLDGWNGQFGQPVGRLVSFGANQIRAGRLGIIRETAAVTNQVPNPRGEGARVGTVTGGSPTGALPTGWVIDATGGVTWTVVDRFIGDDGLEYVRIRFNGTASGVIRLEFMSTSEGTWTGTNKTGSFVARLAAGSLTNMGQCDIHVREVGVAVTSAAVTPLDATARRYFVTRARTGGTGTGLVRIAFPSASGAVDCTLDLAVPQFEDGTVCNHPVLPQPGSDPAASTKAASTFTPSAALNARSTRRFYPGGWDFSNGGVINGQFTEKIANNTMGEDGRLLLSGANTNLLRNPRAEGAVAGSPGTAPTHWSLRSDGASGLSPGTTVVGSGVENGHDYFEVVWDNSSKGSGSTPFLQFEESASIAATAGDVFTLSFGIRVMEGAISAGTARILQNGGAGPVISSNFSILPGRSHRRYRETFTATGAVTALTTRTDLTIPANTRTRVRIYVPHFGQSPIALPPVVPPRGTLATSTAALDNLSIPVSADWLRSMTQGAILCEFVATDFGYSGATGGTHYWELTQGSDFLRFRTNNSNGSLVVQRSISSVVQTITGPTVSPNVPVRGVLSWSGGVGKLSVNGGAIISDTLDPSALAPTALGIRQGNNVPACYINDLIYFPTALTDAQIVALSRL